MSFANMARVWEMQGIEPDRKFILLAIADAVGEMFNPADAIRIATKMTGCEPQRVEQVVNEAIQVGLFMPEKYNPGLYCWKDKD